MASRACHRKSQSSASVRLATTILLATIMLTIIKLTPSSASLQPPPPPPHNNLYYSIYNPDASSEQQSPCLLTLNRTASSSFLSSPLNSAATSYYNDNWTPDYHQRQEVCISERDVSEALEEARRLCRAAAGGREFNSGAGALTVASSEAPKPIQIIELANVIARASELLAKRFSLSAGEILYALPTIDASRSPSLAATCPALLLRDAPRPDPQAHPLAGSNSYVARDEMCLADEERASASNKHFRSLSGFCNNAHERSWGSARSAMVRFLAPDYADSLGAPRVAQDGSQLPSPRVVSFVAHQDAPECDPRHSLLGVVWGQFINHDVNLGVRITEEDETLRDLDCCKALAAAAETGEGGGGGEGAPVLNHEDCFPIEIPKGDPFYGYFNAKCMNFVRLAGALQPTCALGPRAPMNKQSSYLDGSSIYGSSSATIKRLRTFHGGQLRSQPVNSMLPAVTSAGTPTLAVPSAAAAVASLALSRGGAYRAPLFKNLLPPNEHAPDVGCERRMRPKDLFCFDSGDSRANEQISLASLHTIFMREHNRLAAALASLNPHWTDERLFQEARAIVIAQLQHITFAEFLPLVLGKRNMHEFGLELEAPGRNFEHYDEKTNAGVRVEFQSAAFRFGHSLVPGHIERYNKFHQPIESIRLSKLLKQPFDLYYPGVLDTYLLGLANQRAGRMDSSLTTEVANHLFEKPGNLFGMDLAAINIQRARELGVRGYNSYREYCGLPRASSFLDLVGVFHNRTLLRLAQLYRHVDDIDLFTGGLAERPYVAATGGRDGAYGSDGALVGPTFACLIAKQFEALRRGDRFWYENAGGNFRLDQQDEIRRTTSSARLLCDNSDDIVDIQARAMLTPDAHTNPRHPCSSYPSLDLSKWLERPSGSPVEAPDYYRKPVDHDDGVTYKHEHNLQAPPQPVEMPLGDYELFDKVDPSGAQFSPGHYSPVRVSSLVQHSNEAASTAATHGRHAASEPTVAISTTFVDHLVDATNFRPESLLPSATLDYLLGKAGARSGRS